MAVARSAGVMLFRHGAEGLQVLLAHPGGPYWRNKDAGAWQLPKGALEPGEDVEAAAMREAREELGIAVAGKLVSLGEVRQAGGKWGSAFAVEQDCDPTAIRSNHFDLEWPPRSGAMQSFPEIDRACWFTIEDARQMMLPSQQPFLDRLEDAVRGA